MTLAYVNNAYIPLSEGKISPYDLGFLRGFGVFEYFRTYNQKLFHVNDRLQRLIESAKALSIPLALSIPQLQEILLTLLKKNLFDESTFRIIVTGGVSEDGITLPKESSLIILNEPLRPFPLYLYTEGVHAKTFLFNRFMPAIKTTSYAPALYMLAEAKLQGAQEILYVNAAQEILEASTANFFAFKGDVLCTPPAQEILPGITRKVLLKIAPSFFQVQERPLHLNEVETFSEAFICSSVKEMIPVVAINKISIGTERLGKNTQTLMQAFREYTRFT